MQQFWGENADIPANRPDFIGIVMIFELQDLKKSGHSNFLRKKKFSLGNKVSIFDICFSLEPLETFLNPIVLLSMHVVLGTISNNI